MKDYYERTLRMVDFCDELIQAGKRLHEWAVENNPPPDPPFKIGDRVKFVHSMLPDMTEEIPIGSLGTIVGLEEPATKVNRNLWLVDFDCWNGGSWGMEEEEIARVKEN